MTKKRGSGPLAWFGRQPITMRVAVLAFCGALLGSLTNGLFSLGNTVLSKSMADAVSITPTPSSKQLKLEEIILNDDRFNRSSLPCVYAIQKNKGFPPNNQNYLLYYSAEAWSVHANGELLISGTPVAHEEVNSYPEFRLRNLNSFKVSIDEVDLRIVSYDPPSSLADFQLIYIDSCNDTRQPSITQSSATSGYVRPPTRTTTYPLPDLLVASPAGYTNTKIPYDIPAGEDVSFIIPFASEFSSGDYVYYIQVHTSDYFDRRDTVSSHYLHLRRLYATINELQKMPAFVAK